jgi:hypothetical protein
MPNRIEGVGKDDALRSIRWIDIIRSEEATYSISESDLENRPVLLTQSCCYLSMTTTKLQQTPKDWVSRNFGDALDFGRICLVEVSDENVDKAY